MYFNIPVTAPVKTASAPTEAGTRKRTSREPQTQRVWSFATYKEVFAFSWSKNFAYPENSYTPRLIGGVWTVAEVRRPKEEKPDRD